MVVLPRVLKLPRVDPPADENDFLLLHVLSTGKRALDLKLVGTEGDNVYTVTIQHSNISALQHAHYKGTDDEFEHILSVVLLGVEGDESTRDIEAVARTKKTSTTIHIQKRIEGITQKYGEIKANITDEEEIDFVGWVALAIDAGNKNGLEMEAIKKSLQEKETESRKLSEALAELQQLKNDHENSLFEKFAMLLNEKKSKIRDQQRILACASVDESKLAAVEASRIGADPRSPGPSAARKRKNAVKDESDSDTGFEKMDVDVVPEKEDTDSEDERQRQETPDQSTVEEDSENDAPTFSQSRRPVLPPPKQASGNGKAGGPPTSELPPRRELPFAREKVPAPKPVPASEPDDGSETEDDEL